MFSLKYFFRLTRRISQKMCSMPTYLYRHGEGYRGLIRKYKGCTGAIKGLYHVPGTQYFGAVGLDRHLRIYTIKVNHTLDMCSSTKSNWCFSKEASFTYDNHFKKFRWIVIYILYARCICSVKKLFFFLFFFKAER